jgi:hypothetical protein
VAGYQFGEWPHRVARIGLRAVPHQNRRTCSVAEQVHPSTVGVLCCRHIDESARRTGSLTAHAAILRVGSPCLRFAR